MNQFFAYKTLVNKFWLNFFTWIINLLLIKQQYDNFDWIDSNLIVHNLLTHSLDYFSFMHFLASSSYF